MRLCYFLRFLHVWKDIISSGSLSFRLSLNQGNLNLEIQTIDTFLEDLSVFRCVSISGLWPCQKQIEITSLKKIIYCRNTARLCLYWIIVQVPTFLHCVFSNELSIRLTLRLQNYIACICQTFLHCVFSNVSSNWLHLHICTVTLIAFV